AAPAGRSSAADVSAVVTSLPGGAARNSPARSPAAPPPPHPGTSEGTLRARRVRRLRRPRPGRGRTVARGAAGELGGGGAAGELAGQGAAEGVVLGAGPFEGFEGLGEVGGGEQPDRVHGPAPERGGRGGPARARPRTSSSGRFLSRYSRASASSAVVSSRTGFTAQRGSARFAGGGAARGSVFTEKPFLFGFGKRGAAAGGEFTCSIRIAAC